MSDTPGIIEDKQIRMLRVRYEDSPEGLSNLCELAAKEFPDGYHFSPATYAGAFALTRIVYGANIE